MAKKIITYNICTVSNGSSALKDLIVSRLEEFSRKHASMLFPHRHTFYQVLYITEGGGSHIIDFEKFEVKPGMVFLLSPGQVHKWLFSEGTRGILINFSESFFSSFLANRYYVNEFIFFSGNPFYSFADLSGNNLTNTTVQSLMRRILAEYNECDDCRLDLIRTLILLLFFELNKSITERSSQGSSAHSYYLLRKFQKLTDLYYGEKRLPREYAEILCITPNHLNALCTQLTGSSAGAIIRNRILLEAKRLLINSENSVSEIAWQLHFKDNSYFSRFFKKYEGLGPDEFRKQWM